MKSSNSGRRKLAFAIWVIALVFPILSGATEVRIAGTGNAIGTMKLIANAYNQSHPQSNVDVLESIGTSGALRAIIKGSIDIGLASRTLTNEEMQQGLSVLEYARTPTVFAVRGVNTVTAITTKEILDIYSGTMTLWPNGKLIRPILRQPGDDNTKQIMALSPEMEKALNLAKDRSGIPFAVTDQDAANKMESIPGSIGVTTLGLILSEKRSLRALSLDGVEPTLQNIQSGRYPMAKHFYFILPKNPSPDAMRFIQFVKSPKGQAILNRTGHVIP